MKRLLYLLTIVLVVVVVVLGGMLLSRRLSPEPGQTGGGSPTPGGGLPVAPGAGAGTDPDGLPIPGGTGTTSNYQGQNFSRVSDSIAVDFFTHKDGSVIWLQPDGQIFRVRSGQVSTLSATPIKNLMRVHFSYDGNKILALSGERSDPQASIFDVTAKTWRPLSQKIKSAAWSPVNYQMAYLGERGGAGAILILDTSRADAVPQEVTKLSLQDVDVLWPASNQLVIAERGSAAAKGGVWALNIRDKAFVSLAAEIPGLDSAWGEGFGLVFASDPSGRGGQLHLHNMLGTRLHEMTFLTLPSKCAFHTEVSVTSTRTTAPTGGRTVVTTSTVETAMLYCAIPRESGQFGLASLPDSYFQKEFFTTDNIYSVNLEDGSIKPIAAGGQAFDATKLKVFNKTLFFINRLDNKLYAAPL